MRSSSDKEKVEIKLPKNWKFCYDIEGDRILNRKLFDGKGELICIRLDVSRKQSGCYGDWEGEMEVLSVFSHKDRDWIVKFSDNESRKKFESYSPWIPTWFDSRSFRRRIKGGLYDM